MRRDRWDSALLGNASDIQAFKLIWCGDIDCGKTPTMAQKKTKTVADIRFDEWYGRAFELTA
jgi:hypothetical protein